MRGVSRRSSGPGRCRTTVRSRPTSLPTPCRCSPMRRRYRAQCDLARLPRPAPVVRGRRARRGGGDRLRHVRRPAPARAGLLPPRLRRHLLVPRLPGDHGAVGAHVARRRLPAARRSRARRHDRPRRRGVLRDPPAHARRARDRDARADPLLDAGVLVRLRPAAAVRADLRPAAVTGLLPSAGLRGAAREPVAVLRGDARAVDPGRRAVRRGRDAARAGGDPARRSTATTCAPPPPRGCRGER